MIFNSLITQLVMAGVSLGIIFTYVQPTFTEIGETQSAIEQYKAESLKVDEVNATLQSLVSKVNNISERDKRALTTYMPDSVDHVSVSRDVYIMSKQSETFLDSIKYEGVKTEITQTNQPTNSPAKHSFSVSVSGTYAQIKSFLGLLERSNYPLEVHEFKLSSTESGLISIELTLITYSRI
jgi:hypothetical protein